MPAERIGMRDAREIVRLRFSSVSTHEIARRLGMARSTVRETLKRMETAGLSWPLPEDMSDGALEAALYAGRRSKRGHRRIDPRDHLSGICYALPVMTLWLLYDPADGVDPRDQQALIAWAERNLRAFEERAERNPWTHELRAVLAEADRTGDRRPIDDFVRRFKEDEARRLPKG